MSDTRDLILDAAQRKVQSEGFHGFSFRDLAHEVGIKSASIHYHFPSKADLSCALVSRYTERLLAKLGSPDAARATGEALAAYISAFRETLAQDGRMCLAGILAAETDTLPLSVRAEIITFVDANIAWISAVLHRDLHGSRPGRASAIFSALEGAMLVARGTGRIELFDELVRSYVEAGLIPA